MSKRGMMLPRGMVAVVALLAATGANAGRAGAGAGDPDLETRVAARAAIEQVYWSHRLWPAANEGSKPALSEILPESALRAAVENDRLEARALAQLWGRPIGDSELRAEVERMVTTSHAPGVLREIFAALGNDPVLVAEVLARPLLTDRLIREAYASDPRFHGELKAAIERTLARHPALADLRREGDYSEADWVRADRKAARSGKRAGIRVIPMNEDTWRRGLTRLDSQSVGAPGALQEDDERFFVQAVLEKNEGRVRVATVAWRKKPFDAWWAEAGASFASGAADFDAYGSSRAQADGASLETITPALAANCVADTWEAVQTTGAPSARESFSAVWTGTEMIIWGGYNGTTNLDTNTGGRYNPATNSWTATTTTGAPVLRDSHTAVWTGTKMVIWGGGDEVFNAKNTGGRYDPATNTWLATSTTGAAAARLYHTAVWTGSKMIVWGGWAGGTNGRDMDTGGQYDPAGDSWTATTRTGAPSSRDTLVAAWSGNRMVVWGGQDDNAVAQGTGGRYDPVGNAWTATSSTNAPTARWMHSGVWTGSRLIVWGGFDGNTDLNDGALYDPAADAWTATSTTGAPAGRELHQAVWADQVSEMIVWGGQDDAVNPLTSGGRYNPATGVWSATSTVGAPLSGRYGAGVWTGSELIVWGGWSTALNPDADLNTGGRYCDSGCASPAPGGGTTVSVTMQSGSEVVSWTALAGADSYDLVRGSLALLNSSGGNYTTATQACLANDQVTATYIDATLPPVGGGFWYLVRGLSCGGAGTYDSGAASQVGSRDAEIAASASACP